jgi:hypothetical protein
MILHLEERTLTNKLTDKITIIEGPPPVFEFVADGWALGLNESPFLYDISLTKVRTFNGPALVERCHRMWKKNGNMTLLYRNDMGVEEEAPIMAARSVDTEEGQVLLLWIRNIPEIGGEEEDIDSSEEAGEN